MTSSRRSMIAALVLFVLIAATMLGSMAWATTASLQLARQNVAEEHRTRVQGALRRIESYIMGIINSEAARDFNEYYDHFSVEPDVVELDDGRLLNPRYVDVKIPSNLALRDPPFSWMDLHFVIDPQGSLGSPQIPDASAGWLTDRCDFSPEFSQRARQTWSWLEKVYPTLDLRQRIDAAFNQERKWDESAADFATGAAPTDGPTSTAGNEGKALSASQKQAAKMAYRRDVSKAQRGYLPPIACISPELMAQNFRTLMANRRAAAEESSDVSLTPGPFAPAFWLESPSGGTPKLAFVREYFVDRDVFYQGFIGDWSNLEEELLSKISDGFPEADLEPIAADAELNEETAPLKVPYVPAVLRVPGIPGGIDAAAWASVRWQILTSWGAAAAVLVIAGLGVRNLVALTERRMQFAYAVTHELRTPLTTFRLYSDMLSAGLVPESAKQEYLDTLNRESVRLSRLVEEILEYARLENQKVRLHVTQTDAPGLLRVLGETLEKLCRHNGIEGQASNLIPNGKVIRTDMNVVNQITGVLVNNACRHARSSPNPLVKVEIGGENGRLFVDVIDTGPGVDRTDSRVIFKPFRRGKDADKAARGGIGLGLALARNWAKLLGGRLDLVARHHPKYKGAHFRLTIPSDGIEA